MESLQVLYDSLLKDHELLSLKSKSNENVLNQKIDYLTEQLSQYRIQLSSCRKKIYIKESDELLEPKQKEAYVNNNVDINR